MNTQNTAVVYADSYMTNGLPPTSASSSRGSSTNNNYVALSSVSSSASAANRSLETNDSNVIDSCELNFAERRQMTRTTNYTNDANFALAMQFRSPMPGYNFRVNRERGNSGGSSSPDSIQDEFVVVGSDDKEPDEFSSWVCGVGGHNSSSSYPAPTSMTCSMSSSIGDHSPMSLVRRMGEITGNIEKIEANQNHVLNQLTEEVRPGGAVKVNAALKQLDETQLELEQKNKEIQELKELLRRKEDNTTDLTMKIRSLDEKTRSIEEILREEKCKNEVLVKKVEMCEKWKHQEDNDMHRKLSTTQKEFDDLRVKYEQEINQLQTEKSDFETLNNQLKHNCKSLKKALEENDVKSNYNENYRKKFEESEAENRRLREELNKMQYNCGVVEELRKDRKKLDEKADAREKELQVLKDEKDLLADQLKKNKKQLREESQKVESLQSVISNLQKRLGENEEMMSNMEKEIKNTRVAWENGKQENAKLEQTLKEMRSQLQPYGDESLPYEQLSRTCVKFQQDVMESERRFRNLSSTYRQLNETYSEVNRQVEQLKWVVKSKEKEIGQLKKCVEELNEERDLYKAQCTIHEQDFKEERERADKLKSMFEQNREQWEKEEKELKTKLAKFEVIKLEEDERYLRASNHHLTANDRTQTAATNQSQFGSNVSGYSSSGSSSYSMSPYSNTNYPKQQGQHSTMRTMASASAYPTGYGNNTEAEMGGDVVPAGHQHGGETGWNYFKRKESKREKRPEKIDFSCPFCNEKFQNEPGLTVHINEDHDFY